MVAQGEVLECDASAAVVASITILRRGLPQAIKVSVNARFVCLEKLALLVRGAWEGLDEVGDLSWEIVCSAAFDGAKIDIWEG